MINFTEQQIVAPEKNTLQYEQLPLIFPENKNQNKILPMPWNSYWCAFVQCQEYINCHEFKKEYQLLNFDNSHFDLSNQLLGAGYTVTKFDIFKKNKIADTKALPFADESFEVIVGIDILNYIDIKDSMNEMKRVLKKNGIAIFRAPVRLPLFDKFRYSKLISFFIPPYVTTKSRDYRAKIQLNELDIKAIKNVFPNMNIERSHVLSRLDYYFRESNDQRPSLLEKWDHFFLKFIPYYGLLGGVTLLILKKNS